MGGDQAAGAHFRCSAGVYGRWLLDAALQRLFLALDRHLCRSERPEKLYNDSLVTAAKRAITYRELLSTRRRRLGTPCFDDLGVAAGDQGADLHADNGGNDRRHASPARASGFVHFGRVLVSFAAKELARGRASTTRSRRSFGPRGAASSRARSLPSLSRLSILAISLAGHKPASCVLYQRPQTQAGMGETRWTGTRSSPAATTAGKWRLALTSPPPTCPLYSLYWPHRNRRRAWCATSAAIWLVCFSWRRSMMSSLARRFGPAPTSAGGRGAPLHRPRAGAKRNGCASVLYEGKPVGRSDASAFRRDQGLQGCSFFTAPTAFRAVRKGKNPQAKLPKNYDITSMRTSSSLANGPTRTEGAPQKSLGRAWSVDHWWQTGTGWPIAANPVGLGILLILALALCADARL